MRRPSRSASCPSTPVRPRRSLHPDRPVLPVVEGARERLRGAVFIELAGHAERPHARSRRRAGSEALNRATARPSAARRSSCSAWRTRPTSTTSARARRSTSWRSSASAARRSSTAIRIAESIRFAGAKLKSVPFTASSIKRFDCAGDRDRAQDVQHTRTSCAGRRRSWTRATRWRARSRTRSCACSSRAHRGKANGPPLELRAAGRIVSAREFSAGRFTAPACARARAGREHAHGTRRRVREHEQRWPSADVTTSDTRTSGSPWRARPACGRHAGLARRRATWLAL